MKYVREADGVFYKIVNNKKVLITKKEYIDYAKELLKTTINKTVNYDFVVLTIPRYCLDGGNKMAVEYKISNLFKWFWKHNICPYVGEGAKKDRNKYLPGYIIFDVKQKPQMIQLLKDYSPRKTISLPKELFKDTKKLHKTLLPYFEKTYNLVLIITIPKQRIFLLNFYFDGMFGLLKYAKVTMPSICDSFPGGLIKK
jgi:hypothetical protein